LHPVSLTGDEGTGLGEARRMPKFFVDERQNILKFFYNNERLKTKILVGL
jgi:hypothetical protein